MASKDLNEVQQIIEDVSDNCDEYVCSIRYKDKKKTPQRMPPSNTSQRVKKKIYVAHDKEACLYAHNKARHFHSVSPLSWDQDLAQGALNWAVYLLDNDKFHHGASYPVGENLYTVSGQDHICRVYEAVYTEYMQVKNCNFDDLDKYSNDEAAFESVGNFSQIVWKNTKRVGSGIAYDADGKKTVIVMRYNPGQGYNFKQQVLPPTTKDFTAERKEFISPNDNQPTLRMMTHYYTA